MDAVVGLPRCFTAPTFVTFAALAVGFIAHTGPGTVCGMLVGAGLERCWPHDRAHRLFSAARWAADEVGLSLAGLIVDRLVPGQRAADGGGGRHPVHPRRAQGPCRVLASRCLGEQGRAYARGNCWVVLGLVVTLPVVSRPLCLPLLFRLWAPKQTTKIVYARQLVDMLAWSRRVIIAANYRPQHSDHPNPAEIAAVQLAWAQATA